MTRGVVPLRLRVVIEPNRRPAERLDKSGRSVTVRAAMAASSTSSCPVPVCGTALTGIAAVTPGSLEILVASGPWENSGDWTLTCAPVAKAAWS